MTRPPPASILHVRSARRPVASFTSKLMAARGGKVHPHMRRNIVLRYTVSQGVSQPRSELRLSETLSGREPEPTGSLLIVLRHALPAGVRHPEVVLRSGTRETLCRGGEPEPPDGLPVILRHARDPPVTPAGERERPHDPLQSFNPVRFSRQPDPE